MNNLTTYIDIYRDEMKDVELCEGCGTIRQPGQFSCCGDVYFVKFKDLPKDEQVEMAMFEYESNHK